MPRKSILRRAAMEIRFDQQPGPAAEAHAIDLEIFEHALDVVARLREWDALDPVDRIDLGIARIAEFLDPLLHPPAAGIVADKGEDVGAAVVHDQVAEL